MDIQAILAKINFTSIEEVAALTNPKDIDVSMLNITEMKALSEAVEKYKGITVQPNGEVKANSHIIGHAFSSVYFNWGKAYGTPKTKTAEAQLCLVIIPEVLGFQPKAEAWDEAEPIYKAGDWEDYTSDGKKVTVSDQVVAKLQSYSYSIPVENITLVEKKVPDFDKPKGTMKTVWVVPMELGKFLESITRHKVTKTIFGEVTEDGTLLADLKEMQGHLSKAQTLMVKISSTGEVRFYKKHTSRMGTPLIG